MDEKNLIVEFFLAGGHTIQALITAEQLEYVVSKIVVNDGSITYVDDISHNDPRKTVIAVDHIVAIRYKNTEEESE